MRCFRCKKEILKEEAYFQIMEFENEEKLETNYVHKTCWNNFLNQVGSVEESMSLIRGLKQWFIKKEILPEEEYKIVS